MNLLKKLLNKILNKEEVFAPKLYPARDCVLLTTKSDIELVPCIVKDDHKVEIKTGFRDKKSIRINTEPSILTLPLRAIWPHPLFKYWAPRRQRYRVFTTKKEGEFTHNPNTSGVTVESEKRFEEALKLEGQMIEAHLTREAVKDMKDHRKQWFDYIPYICMAVMGIIIVWIMNGD